ncbi:metalloendopeptidase [Sporobolomyces salmoneus]|uniref:metalloendopeptidase n=1 Tax=Sporobolomyces salmoneus TaxID=183962 RepID=UPI003182B1B8
MLRSTSASALRPSRLFRLSSLPSSSPIRQNRGLSATSSIRQRAASAKSPSLSSSRPPDDVLHQAFDTPSSSYTTSPTSISPSGLFNQPLLTSPSGFPLLASRTTLRAKVLVDRIVRLGQAPKPESIEQAEQALLVMVKNLDRLSDLLCGVIDLAELVRNVHPDPAWVEGANEAYEQLCEYMNELNVHVGLYEGLKSIHSLLPETTPSKSPALFAAYAVATPFLRDFEKSGIHLPDHERSEFVSLSTSILQLGRKFLQNASDPDAREPVQVTRSEIEQAFGKITANKIFPLEMGDEGWIEPTSWEGRVSARHHPDSRVRQRFYVAAHSAPKDHVETLEKLLLERARLARLVGRNSWAEVALEDKMARTPESVEGFLNALERHNRPLAEKDLDKLRNVKAVQFAQTEGGRRGDNARTINAWDRDFLTDLSGSSTSPLPDISPFFSVGACFAGLSRLFSNLYGIRFEVEEPQAGEVWAEGVRKLKVVDEEEGRIGTIYCDLFAREGKAPGAAHYTVRCSRRVDDDDVEGDFEGRSYAMIDGVEVQRSEMEGIVVEPTEYRGREGKHQEPIVVLVCAFGNAEGAGKAPAFLQWHEVETLAHETGHALHSMIGRTEYHNVAGTRCATDFVEFPSILMEHFISSPSVLSLFAKHHRTGHTLPSSIFDQLVAERSRFSALETSSQIMMAALDQAYHSPILSNSDSSFDSTRVLSQIQSRYHVIPHADSTCWQTQFGHLFGYGATYYSYLFDRAIAARVFTTKFAQDPLNRERGEELKKKVLRFGGGREPWELIGELVGDERVARGGKEAMEEVGKWGIEDAARGE